MCGVLDAADRDEIIARIKVVDLVKSLPGVGPVGAQHILDGIGIDTARRLGGLRVRQRQQLIDATAYPDPVAQEISVVNRLFRDAVELVEFNRSADTHRGYRHRRRLGSRSRR